MSDQPGHGQHPRGWVDGRRGLGVSQTGITVGAAASAGGSPPIPPIPPPPLSPAALSIPLPSAQPPPPATLASSSPAAPPRPRGDSILLKIEIPSTGIEVKQTKKYRRTATVKDILDSCKTSLKPCFHTYPFHLETKSRERLIESKTIEESGLTELQELLMLPESEADIEALLSKDAPKRPASESTAIHQQFVKSGFLFIGKVKHRGRGTPSRKKRWCVLKENAIYYFASPKDRVADGYFDLDHAKISFFGDDQDEEAAVPAASGPPGAAPAATGASAGGSGGKKKEKDANILFFIVTPELEKYVLTAESEAEAKSWYTAVASRSPTDTSDHTQRVRNALVSGYVTKRARGVATQHKFAVLSGTVLFFSESPADQQSAVPTELFSTKIVHYDDRHEISIKSLGEEGFVIAPETEAEYGEWVRALKKSLGNFVSSSVDELAVDLAHDIVKAGYMLKKKANRRFSTTKKRWFVLKGNKLFYSHAHTDTRPLGVIDLLHTQANFYILDDEDQTSRKKNAQLELVTTGGVYSLKHPESSESELREWCEAIKLGCVGIPFNVVHKQHVDFDYNWSGGNPKDLFEFQEKIGEGAFAVVHRAKHRDTGFELAIKILKLKEETSLSLQQEIDVLKILKSPQIVLYFGTCIVPGQLWILTQYCACGSIKDIMKATLETLNEAQLAYVCTETLKGLLYLHSMKIIHHDIKAGNILLTEESQVKLADFGVSQQFQDTEKIHAENFIGSPLYMSPEVLRKSVYNQKTDVWSLGITVIEMAEGSPPNFGITSFERLLQQHQRAPPQLGTSGGWSPGIRDFVGRCLVMDPESRADTIELLAHPFLRAGGGSQVNSMKPLVAECLKLRPKPPPTAAPQPAPAASIPPPGSSVSSASSARATTRPKP